MPINTDKFKDFVQSFGFGIDFTDGQVLLTAYKEFGKVYKSAYTEEEQKILNQAFILIKKVADNEFDDFWQRYNNEKKPELDEIPKG